jgi:hypothetical protein
VQAQQSLELIEVPIDLDDYHTSRLKENRVGRYVHRQQSPSFKQTKATPNRLNIHIPKLEYR